MIFVTVGHQMPFDRLIRLVDRWAGENPNVEIFAQIGESGYQPKHLEFAKILTRSTFDAYLRRCSAVAAHAGTGTIIQSLLAGKPLLVYPRLSELSETRNDHQVGTARQFASRGYVLAAYSEKEFLAAMARVQEFRPSAQLASSVSFQLLSRIRAFASKVQTDPQNNTIAD